MDTQQEIHNRLKKSFDIANLTIAQTQAQIGGEAYTSILYGTYNPVSADLFNSISLPLRRFLM